MPAPVRTTVRALASLAALAAVLVGVPWFLARFADPRPLLAVDWPRVVSGPPDAELLVALLGLLGWAAWAYLTAAVVLEAASLLSRRRLAVTLPGTGWLRPTVAALLVAAAASPVVAASADPGTATPPAPGTRDPAAEKSDPDESPDESSTHVVGAGEELWDIAEQQLGSGDRWREIVEANPGLDATARLEPGTRLRLPERPDAARAAGTAETRVVVQRGDTLWGIAEQALGDPLRWPEIHEANRELVADPDEIQVGWVLRLPEVVEEPTDAAAEEAPVGAEPPAAAQEPHDSARAVADPADTGTLSVESVETRNAADEVPVSSATAEASLPTGPGADTAAKPSAGQVAAIGAALAAAVLGGLATRRRAQLLGRAVGRRLVPIPDQVARFWTALSQRAEQHEPGPMRGITPTTVVLGWDDDGAQVLLDLAVERATRLTGPQAEALLAALVTGLSCAPWSDEVQLIVTGDTAWAEALDDPRIEAVASPYDAITRLSRLCSERRLALRSRTLGEVSSDPDVGQAWAPVVFVFERPLTGTQPDAVADALALGEVGVQVLLTGDPPLPNGPSTTVEAGSDLARWGDLEFTPQLVSGPARRALIDLFEATGSPRTLPAPWWGHPRTQPIDPSEEPAMTGQPASPGHPQVMLLGDVDLVDAAGPPPSRARTSCIEYAAWLLAHPGSRASTMASDLLVAEGTRRSNMSRLRTWLGADPDGTPYLPDAYSGHISLDPRVSSDWEQFQALLGAGVQGSPDAALRSALRLVRGQPLGTAAFQWPWAETLRADMVAMVVDASCTLADRAIQRGDAVLALWAAGRGRLAAPRDDEVAVREIDGLALAGRGDEARSAVLAVTRAARAAGRDLAPHLALRISLVLERERAVASAG